MSNREVTSPVSDGSVLHDVFDRQDHHHVRQIIDATIATFAMAFVIIPIIILVLVIRLDSPGPAIFRQTRLGKDLRPFIFYKFRTMYRDAATRFPELYDYSSNAGQDFQFKQRSDPRLTRIGRLLRPTGLDELPNLFNVMKGDCALVGPRPDIPELLEQYSEVQRIRFSVPQGLVCLAQVQGANRLTFNETADLDVKYVRMRSIKMDIRIILDVVRTLLRGDLH